MTVKVIVFEPEKGIIQEGELISVDKYEHLRFCKLRVPNMKEPQLYHAAFCLRDTPENRKFVTTMKCDFDVIQSLKDEVMQRLYEHLNRYKQEGWK
jgi:hypothetical protein